MYNEDKFIEEFTNSIDDGWMGCLDSVTGAGTPRVWSAIWFLDPQRNGTPAREEGAGGGLDLPETIFWSIFWLFVLIQLGLPSLKDISLRSFNI